MSDAAYSNPPFTEDLVREFEEASGSGIIPALSGPSTHFCGPNIDNALERLARAFEKFWMQGIGLFVGPDFPSLDVRSWDIVELHFPMKPPLGDYYLYKAPICQVPEECQPSVWAGDNCWYTGSVNYVLYGWIYRLLTVRNIGERGQPGMGLGVPTSEDRLRSADIEMTQTIIAWKALNAPDDSGLDEMVEYLQAVNTAAAVMWARAGIRGYPLASRDAPRPGDRSSCKKCQNIDYEHELTARIYGSGWFFNISSAGTWTGSRAN